MKAAVYTSHGSSDVIEIQELDTPEINHDEVLIKVHAFALNRLDLWTREGLPNLEIDFPHVGSSDFAGTIVSIGNNVDNYNIGDRVIVNPTISCNTCLHCKNGEISLCDEFSLLGEHRWGGAAEYAKAPARNLKLIPEGISFSDTVAVSLTAMTAYRMIHTKANCKPGDLVLITGSGGGIGTIATQISKHFGARVIAITSTQEKIKKAKELGAEYVINYKQDENWHKTIHEYTNGKGVDIVIDSSGQAVFEKSMRILAKNGRYVTCGATTGAKGMVNLAAIFWKQLSIIGSSMASHSEFEEALTLFFEGKIHPVIDSKFDFDNVLDAHKRLENPEHLGKIVIEIIKD